MTGCTIEMGFILEDILTGLERVSDHCSNIAVLILVQGRAYQFGLPMLKYKSAHC